MRKLPLLIAAAVAAIAVLSVPPAHAQAKCGNDLCIGSAGTQMHVKGNILADRPILAGTSAGVIIDAGVTIVGSVVTTGTEKMAVLDAGTGLINGDLQVTGNVIASGTGTATTCTLGGQSPSTCTATVRAGSKCTCSNVGGSAAIAAAGCAVSLTSTTLTVTSANAGSNVVNIHCL